MNRENLLNALSLTLTKAKVQELADLAGKAEFSVHDLLQLCFLKEKPALAFRSAWVLEHVAAQYPELFLPCFPEFIKRLPEQDNLSCQRHFTKILMLFTGPKALPQYNVAWAAVPDHEAVVEVVFEWLINPATPVAVRVNCLDILLHLSDEFPWVREELQAQTEFFLKNGSPAMLSRGRKILSKAQKRTF